MHTSWRPRARGNDSDHVLFSGLTQTGDLFALILFFGKRGLSQALLFFKGNLTSPVFPLATPAVDPDASVTEDLSLERTSILFGPAANSSYAYRT